MACNFRSNDQIGTKFGTCHPVRIFFNELKDNVQNVAGDFVIKQKP